MKKFTFFCILIFCVYSASCFSQWVQFPSGMGTARPIYSLISNSANSVFAGTDSGVYRSPNFGNPWTQTTLNNRYIYSLAAAGSNVFAGTPGNGVYLSTNAGLSWAQTTLNTQIINAIAVNGIYTFAGCGSGLGVYSTTNNGTSWIPAGLSGLSILSLSTSGSYIFAGKQGLGISFSTDMGLTWTQSSMTSKSVYTLSAGSGYYYAGTDSGVYSSTNGISWFPTPLNILTYSLQTQGSIVFAGTSTGFYYSTNNGVSWIQRIDGMGTYIIRSLLITNGYIFAGTAFNSVWRRPLSDFIFNQTFTRNNINKTFGNIPPTHDTLFTPIPSGGFRILDVNLKIDTVFNTPDANLNFTLIHQGIYDTAIYHVGGSGSNFLGTMLDDSASVLIQNGTPPFTGLFKPKKPLAQFNNLDPGGFWILRIRDTGASNIQPVCIGTGTTQVNYPFNTYWMDSKTDMLYTASEIIASGGAAGNITQLGFNFATFSSQVMNGFTIKMQNTSLTSLTGFVQTGWQTVYSGTYTVPGTGMQYINLQNPFAWSGTSNVLIEICFDNTSYTLYSNVFGSAAAGMTWSQYTDNAAGCSFAAGTVQATRPNICMMMNHSDSKLSDDNPNLTGVIKSWSITITYQALLPTGVKQTINVIPENYSLSQNYPNPFNPETKIGFDIPKQGFVSLKIYDVLGREVKTLVSETKSAGSYSVDFNGAEFPSGIYFYRIQAGEYYKIMKMVLIK